MEHPIGIFDSGVGGLSVFREIRRELPSETLLYVADSGFAPYGDRPATFIKARAQAILRQFEQFHVKLVVVACNTATAVAVDSLREQSAIPVVAIEPAVKPAAMQTTSGVIGVIATTQTLNTSRFARLVNAFGANVEVIVQPCPGLVEEVEHGQISGPTVEALLTRYVRPIVERGADTLVLGCTHYAFLKDAIQRIAGPGVTLIDPAAAVAREVRRRLSMLDALAADSRGGDEQFWTTGVPADVERVAAVLLQRDVRVSALGS